MYILIDNKMNVFTDLTKDNIKDILTKTYNCGAIVNEDLLTRLDEFNKSLDGPNRTIAQMNELLAIINDIHYCNKYTPNGRKCTTHDKKYNKDIFIAAVKDLLDMCDKTSGRKNKANVAVELMKFTSKSKDFMSDYRGFALVVYNKFIELFNDEYVKNNPDIWDNLVDSFKKIFILKDIKVGTAEIINHPNGSKYVKYNK